MTVLYLLILAALAWDHHGHWHQLYPWTKWFIVLVIVAVLDLGLHRSYIR